MTKGEKHQSFGGNWTIKKLKILKGYLEMYSNALKNQHFKKIYIDAFSGTGYIQPSRKKVGVEGQNSLLFNKMDSKTKSFLSGSAKIALEIEIPFDQYIFIEKNSDCCQHLQSLKKDFPDISININQGDANTEIQKLCSSINWTKNRSVVFIDPYGIEVEWETLEAIASTKAIDLWLLHPLGMGINRLLKKQGDIPENWQQKISKHTGTENFMELFYEKSQSSDLFDDSRTTKKRLTDIGKCYINRLKEIFSEVENPVILRNSLNNPLYLLIFAVSSKEPNAISLALRFARHWVKNHEKLE